MKTKLIVIVSIMIVGVGMGAELPSGSLDPNQPAQTGIDRNGIIISLMSMENRSSELGNVFVRGGYKYGVLEAFGGIEAEKTKVFEFGFLLHSRNVNKPDNVPVLSPLLNSVLDPNMVVTGYTGLHWVKDRRLKEDYSGSIFGINAKTRPDSPISIRGEVHYENKKSDNVTFHAGLAWLF